MLVGDELGQFVQVPLDEVTQGEHDARPADERDVAPLLPNALLAAATAASTSAGSASATWACAAPVAGFQTVPNLVDAPVVSEPAIQC